VSVGNVRVRPASPSDISQLIALSADNGLVDDVARRGRRPETSSLADKYAQLLTNPERLVLVAVQDEVAPAKDRACDDKVVGFAVMMEEQVGVLTPAATLYISRLLVAPSHRRRGVGRALLTATVRHAEDYGIDHVVVGAQAGARDAHRYLARLGFAPLVVRRVASVQTLRRSLGIADSVDRLALRRRRSLRGVLPTRVAGRSV
jgi:GNAT superfamily N-acetyltransferase